MSLRDTRQEEFANLWIEKGEWGILNLVARFGKIRCTILILRKKNYKRVLIVYPDLKIKASWKNDFEIMKYDDSNVTYTTYLSLKKHVDEKYDLIVLDECHLISSAQMEVIKQMKETHRVILGLTGTLSSWTKKDLLTDLHLPVVATYTIDQAISEGVIADYDITVVKVPLDSYELRPYKKTRKTEKGEFNMLSMIINKMESEGRDTMFMRLARMRVIQNSIAKKNATISLLKRFTDNRVLIFSGTINVADNLGIPSYHSKSTEKNIFQDFVSGKLKHLSVVKIGQTGTTYSNLNSVIINYFSSSGEDMAQKILRCMSFEYDNLDKKSHIFIISSTEQVELLWLSKALEFFNPEKIKYL